MDQDRKLDMTLQAFGSSATGDMRDDFMDGVWQRAGRMAEAVDGRRRLALFVVVFVAGLGAGFVSIQEPTRAQDAGYQLVMGPDLSPAALLHTGS